MEPNLEQINEWLKSFSQVGEISDGYHTFNELYKHRIELYLCLCEAIDYRVYIWKSKKHSDESVWDGWFILGIYEDPGEQITYHLPMEYWDRANFQPLDKAPEFDGHTSEDVIQRLQKLQSLLNSN